MAKTNKKWLIFPLLLLSFFSCENSNTKELNAIVEKAYNKCKNKKNCIIDFKTAFPFEWNKMYVFDLNNFPEAEGSIISKIIDLEYNGKKNGNNRSILFIKNDKIIHEIITEYESDGFIDVKPMKVEFVGDLPEYFTPKTAKFRIEKSDDNFILSPIQ